MKRFILALFLSLLIIGTAWGITNIGMPKFQAFDSNGVPLSGGLLYSYDPGSSVSKQTYSDYLGTVGNTNPVVLDSRGEATIYLDGAYKLVLKGSDQVTIWTIDNFQGEGVQYVSTSSSSGYIVLAGPSGTSSFTLVPSISGVSIEDGTIPGIAISPDADITVSKLVSGASISVNVPSSGTSIESVSLNTIIYHASSGSSIYELPEVSGVSMIVIKFIEGTTGGGITIYSAKTGTETFDGNGISGNSYVALSPSNPFESITVYGLQVSGTCSYWYIEPTSGWTAGDI